MELAMSVVNQMLKDLEDRNADEAGETSVYQPPSKSSASSRLNLILIIVIVILLVAGTWIGWQLFQQSSNNQTRDALVTNVIEDSNSEAESRPEPRPMVNLTEQSSEEQVETTSDEVPVKESNSELVESFVESREPVETKLDETEVDSDSSEALNTIIESSTDTTIEPSQVSATAVLEINRAGDDLPTSSSATGSFEKQSSIAQVSNTSLRDRALAAVRAGQEQQAIQLLAELVDSEPRNIAARKKLAAMLFAQNQTARASEVLELGIRAFPQDADMRLMLARLLTRQQREEDAFSLLTPTQPLNNENTEFLGYRAALAEKLGAHQIAYKDYQKLSRDYPEEARWWLGLAVSSERIEENQTAIQAYQRVLNLSQLGADVQQFAQQRISQLVRMQ
jgi:MSHA biogenesis protein MshN